MLAGAASRTRLEAQGRDARDADGGRHLLETVAVSRRADRSYARELASDEETSGRADWSRVLVDGDPHPSKILAEKSRPGDRLGELYDHMYDSSLDLSGLVDKRIDAVMKLPRRIVPRDGTPAAKEAAEFCRAALGVVPSFAINLRHQKMARAKGIAFDEILLEQLSRGPLAGAWVPVDLVDRPMWRFRFEKGVLQVRRGAGRAAIVAAPGKFLAMRSGSKDSPWGRGYFDDIYWHWWLQKNGLKFWTVFLDKWGQPLARGRYKSGRGNGETDQQKQSKLLQILKAVQTESGIVLPEGLDVDLLEASRSGSVSYETFQATLLRSMAVKILGEVDTSGAGKGPGSYGKSVQSNEVRLEKVVGDAHEDDAHLTDTLLRWLTTWNFSPDWPSPLWVTDAVDADDRAQRAEGIEAARKARVPVGERYFRMTHRVPEPDPGEPLVVEASEPAPSPAAANTPPPPAPDTQPTESDPAHDPALDPDTVDDTAIPTPAPKKRAKASAAPPMPFAVRRTMLQQLAAELAGDRSMDKLVTDRDADLQAIAAHFTPRTLDYYGGWKNALLGSFDDGSLHAGHALRNVVGAVNPLESARAIETAQVHGLGAALMHVREDVDPRVLRLEMPPGWQQSSTPSSAIEYWAQQLVVDPGAFTALSDEGRRTAFSVAGVLDMELLHAIHALIGETIAGGWTRERFVAALDALFDARGLTHLSRHRAELVYTNATRTAASLMRYRQLVLNPAAKRLTPYLTWWSLDDGRVRPEHVLMHGYTAAIDHEIWKTWWPPAGHNCRCYIGTVNLAKARRLGYTGSEPMGSWPLFEGAPVLPDEGFRGIPSYPAVTRNMGSKAQDMVDKARSSGSEDLLQAILQLFAQLFSSLADSFEFSTFVQSPAAEPIRQRFTHIEEAA